MSSNATVITNPMVDTMTYNPDHTTCPVPTKPDIRHPLKPGEIEWCIALGVLPSS